MFLVASSVFCLNATGLQKLHGPGESSMPHQDVATYLEIEQGKQMFVWAFTQEPNLKVPLESQQIRTFHSRKMVYNLKYRCNAIEYK